MKIKHKEKILKAAREKQQKTHKGIPIRITANHSIETLQDRRDWQDILKVMKEKNLQSRLLYPARIAGSQCEELRPWQRSWGRRRGIRKGRIEPQETPCSQASTPPNQSPTLLFYALTYTSDFTGGWPTTTSLGEGVNLQFQLIKIPGRDKSVSTYKLLWRFSSLPEQVRTATCDCLQPPNCERHEML